MDRVVESPTEPRDRTSRVERLAGGRRLGYAEFGDPHGQPVLAIHGTPGSRFMFALTDQAARLRGLRIIAPERPGYGLSDYCRKEGLPHAADDLKSLADTLGLDRFAVLGVSGGGPFAIAAASAMPDRVACTDWLHEDRLERTRLRALVKLGTLLAGSEQDKRLRRYQALAGRRVQRGLAVLSRGRFVVTDRLHAHILCLLLDIPHVALNNSYGKVSGFAEQWTADYERFYQARSRAEAFELAFDQIGLLSS